MPMAFMTKISKTKKISVRASKNNNLELFNKIVKYEICLNNSFSASSNSAESIQWYQNEITCPNLKTQFQCKNSLNKKYSE
jgi:hypothetical protein